MAARNGLLVGGGAAFSLLVLVALGGLVATQGAAGPVTSAALRLDLADVYLRHEDTRRARAIYAELARSPDAEVAGRATYGLALVAARQERGDEAAAHLRAAIAGSPSPAGRTKLSVELISLLIEQEKHEAAEALLDDVLASAREPAARATAFRQLVALYRGRHEALLAKVREHVAAHPEELDWLAFLGDVQAEAAQDPSGALEAYEALLARQERGHPALLQRLVELALQVGDVERVLAHGLPLADQLHEQPVARVALLRRLAGAALQAQRPADARALLGQALASAPPALREELQVERFRILQAEGGLEAEAQRLEEAGALDELWLLHARAVPDPARALAVAERLQAARPDDPRVGVLLVQAAAQAEAHERVAGAGLELLERFPAAAGDVGALVAASLARLGRGAEAKQALEQAAARAPRAAPRCFLAIGGLEPAQRSDWQGLALTAARELGDPEVLLHCAQGLRAAQAPREALAAAQAGLALDELPPRWRGPLRWEQLLALEALGRWAEAEALCRRLLEAAGADAAARRAPEQKLLELLQRQGKRVSFGGE